MRSNDLTVTVSARSHATHTRQTSTHSTHAYNPVADTGGGGGVPGVVTPPLRAKHEYHYYVTCL